MAHGSGYDSTPASSKDRGARLSTDDLKIPIIKGLLEQGFSEEDVTLGLFKYREKYPDHVKVEDSDVLDLVMEVSKSNSELNKSDPKLRQNKKKQLHGQNQGSTWINKLQARDNKVYHRNVAQNISRKFESSVPKRHQSDNDDETTHTESDDEESSDEYTKIKTVSKPETKNNSRRNSINSLSNHLSYSSSSDLEIIEVTERTTPASKKKLSKKSFKFDTASNDSDSQKEQYMTKSSPCKAADKTRSGKKSWKKIPVNANMVVSNKRKISNSDSSDENRSPKQNIKTGKSDNDTINTESEQRTTEFSKQSDKARSIPKKLKLSRENMEKAKQLINCIVKISPLKEMNPFQTVNVRKNNDIKDNIETEKTKSSKNEITHPQSTDSSSGNEFDNSPLLSVKKYKKHRPILCSSSSEDDIRNERTIKHKKSPRKRLKKQFDSTSHVTSSQSTVHEDDLTAGSSNEFDTQVVENKTDRNLSSVSTVCDDSDVSTICETDSDESAFLLKTNKLDVNSKRVGLKTSDSNSKSKTSIDDEKDEMNDYNEADSSSSSDDLPELPFNRNSQKQSIVSPKHISKTSLKKVVSAYEQDTETYSDYEIFSASDSDEQVSKSKREQITKQENIKTSVKPINTTDCHVLNNSRNVKPLPAIPAIKSLITHSPDMYSIRSLKTSSGSSEAKTYEGTLNTNRKDLEDEGQIKTNRKDLEDEGQIKTNRKDLEDEGQIKTNRKDLEDEGQIKTNRKDLEDEGQIKTNRKDLEDEGQIKTNRKDLEDEGQIKTNRKDLEDEGQIKTNRKDLEDRDLLEVKKSNDKMSSLENTEFIKNHKSNHINKEVDGVTKSGSGMSNEVREKCIDNKKTVEAINFEDASDGDNKDTLTMADEQVERQNFGYTQDDDCIYVTDDSDSENIYNSLSQQVIYITDDDDESDDGVDDRKKEDVYAKVDDRDDDSDVELSKFFDIHETDDDDDNNQTIHRNKNLDMMSRFIDPECKEIFGKDDAAQNNDNSDDDDDEFDELLEEETKTVIKSTTESNDSTEDEFDELLLESDERKEIKKERDFSDEDKDPFDNLIRPDGNENGSRSIANQPITQKQICDESSKSGNEDKMSYHKNGKQSENTSNRNDLDSKLTKKHSIFHHGLYDALTQLVTTTIASKRMSKKNLQMSRQDLYQAETQLNDKDLDDSDESYDLQTQINDRDKKTPTQRIREELYEAETQVYGDDVSDDSEVYEIQTQITCTKKLNGSNCDYEQQTEIDQIVTPDEPDLPYDEQTQVDINNIALDAPDYCYDKQTQINQNAIRNQPDAEYEDPYGGLTQIDGNDFDKIKQGSGMKTNNVTDSSYFEATQVHYQEVDPYTEATQIDSGDSSVCIVDSDSSSPIKVSRVNRNVFEASMSGSDDSDDAFSSLTQVNKYPNSISNPYLECTQVDNDGNRSLSDSEDDMLSAKKSKSVNYLTEDKNLSSGDNESETEFFSLTQVHIDDVSEFDLPDPYEQCTQLDNDSVFAKFASNKDSSTDYINNRQNLDKQNSCEVKSNRTVRLSSSEINSSSTIQRTGSSSSRKIIELPPQRLKTTQEKRESFRIEKDKFYSTTQTVGTKNESERQSLSVSVDKNMFYSKAPSSSTSTLSHSTKDNRNVGRRTSLDLNKKKRLGSGSDVQKKTKRQKVDIEPISMTRQVTKARKEMEKRMYKRASNPEPIAKQSKKTVTEVKEHSDVSLPSTEEIIKKALPILYSPQKRRNLNTSADNFDRSSAFAKSYDNDSEEQPTTVAPTDIDKYQIQNSEMRNTALLERTETEKEQNKKQKSLYQENAERKEKKTQITDVRDKEGKKDDRKKEKNTKDKDIGDKNNGKKYRDVKQNDSRATEKDKHSRGRSRDSNDGNKKEKDSGERDRSYKDNKDHKEREKVKASTSKENIDKDRERDKEQENISNSTNKLKDKEIFSSSKYKDGDSERNNTGKEKGNASTSKSDKEKEDKRHDAKSNSSVINDNIVKSNTKSILKVSTDVTTTRNKSVKFTLPDVTTAGTSAGTSRGNNSTSIKSGMKTISLDAYKNRQIVGNSDNSVNKGPTSTKCDQSVSQTNRLNSSNVRRDDEVMQQQQKYGSNKPNLMEKVPARQSTTLYNIENHTRNTSASTSQNQAPPVGYQGNIYAELQEKFGACNYIDYFWYRLLLWSPRWLSESEDPRLAGITPPVVEAKDGKLTHIPETFDNFGDYYKIIVPHLLHEVWEMCLRDWKEIKAQKKSLQQKFYFKVLTPHPACPDLIYYTIDGILPKDQYDKGLVLKESSLVILTTVSQNLKQQDQLEDFLQFGLIEKVETFKQPRRIKSLLDSSPVLAEEARKLRKELVLVQYTLKLRKRPKKLPMKRDCVLERLSSLVTVTRQLNAMMLLPKNPLCMDILQPGKTPSVYSESAVVTPTNDKELANYNVSQRKAICTVSMIAKLEPIQRRICLLQGPPGTGKSHTIIGIIKKIMRIKFEFEKVIVLYSSTSAIVHNGHQMTIFDMTCP